MRKSVALFLASAFPIVCSFHSSFSRAANVADSSADRHLVRERPLLEIGPAPKQKWAQPPSANVKVVSYNIRWRSGDELRKLASLLKGDPENGGAAILGLQEVD